MSEGAVIACSFGTAPVPMAVLPESPVFASELPVATLFDVVPVEDIPTFGLCTGLANPEVAAAAAGVLTPMPCPPRPRPGCRARRAS